MRTSGDQDRSMAAALSQCIAGIGALGALVFLIANWTAYQRAIKALSDHDYSIEEGIVTDFKPMPLGGHADESFRVNGVFFSYGSGWGSTIFNSDSNNGFIHNGVPARITYRGSDIFRVEVR